MNLDEPATQELFGTLVGITQPAVSGLVAKGVLPPGAPLRVWLAAYLERLRDQAEGRDSDGGLARERARLAASQRRGQDIRNAKDLGEWAPRDLLEQVLALVSATIADKLQVLPGELAARLPDLPAAAHEAIGRGMASARAEWLRSTASLEFATVNEAALEDDVTGAADNDEDIADS